MLTVGPCAKHGIMKLYVSNTYSEHECV